MESDEEEDFVFYGTPIEREEDLTSRKKKSVAEASGQLRTVVPWQQEVRDEEGRRRFHGAFTGGFSAGYYNSVGSKEGWTPQTFTSSRKKRADTKEQSILNFLDDDEKAEMDGRSLATSSLFDTFGFTAAEVARKQVEKEQQKRPSIIPGPVPDEIVLPAANSIGVKLLLKMGWRHGRSIKDSRTNLLYDARREARKAFLALSSDDAKPPDTQFESNKIDCEDLSEQADMDIKSAFRSTPVYVLNPKHDMHGLGYDPFKHAPEFRERKRLRISGNQELGSRGAFSTKGDLFASKSGKMAPGFGIGALEELDAEDEDVYASGYDFEETYVQDIEEPSTINKDIKLIKSKGEQGVLPGFKVASSSDLQLDRFNPPVIPHDFKPQHKFPAAFEPGKKLAGPPPPEVVPPEDRNLKLLIDGFAALVTRCGKLFEDLSREKNKTNPLFSFLSGGNGHDYYARRLWEEKQKHSDQTKQSSEKRLVPNVQKMTAESRGSILGEKPLEKSYKNSNSSVSSADAVQLQFHLSDTFTKPASLSDTPEVIKPFKADPAKQERFEQFLKEKYQGGLRSTDSGGNSKMSESARARERLDFEAAAEAFAKGTDSASTALYPSQQYKEITVSSNLQFTPGGLETMSKMYPKREEYQWRPAPILCKRFDIADPYMGKLPPPPRARGRIDSLIFASDFVKATKTADNGIDPLLVSQSETQVTGVEEPNSETEIDASDTNVERPVDLYKAIFSDDSDDEGEGSTFKQMQDPEKNSEVVNTTLNRLIAGDFLESLGKELGLEVPPETPIMKDKVNIVSQEALTTNVSKPGNNISAVGPLKVKEVVHGSSSIPEFTPKGASNGLELDHSKRKNEATDIGHFDRKYDKADVQKVNTEVKNSKRKSKRYRSRSSSFSSEDEGSTRHSRRDKRRSSSPSSEEERNRSSRHHQSKDSFSDTDSSDDQRSRGSSRLKAEKKDSSRGKSGRRKHSKHHKSQNKGSPSRSSRRGSDRYGSEDRKSSRKSGDRKRDSVSYKDSRRKYY
ncbi:hypothetical protein AQUCO_02600186v1 [Aquilegia coerulea]|uniref:SURP motif domain-containing protein n=1 Tax=Aquilegia coerulea TaxID=218851 RepID=A0A2G5D7S4_AQUCA|nr:hypothetical protein AQUCO_02600186v1 [Aquilegia coerulea]